MRQNLINLTNRALAYQHCCINDQRLHGCIVNNSIPIPWFGCVDTYLQSDTKIITVGLNPSKEEFPDGVDRFLGANRNNAGSIIDACNKYFTNQPYRTWFDFPETILNTFGATYGLDNGKAFKNYALHTDICSPIATDPVWAKLQTCQRHALFSPMASNVSAWCLWHDLVELLKPDFIFLGVGQQHIQAHFGKPTDNPLWSPLLSKASLRKGRHSVRIAYRTYDLGQHHQTKIVWFSSPNRAFRGVAEQDFQNGDIIGRLIP